MSLTKFQERLLNSRKYRDYFYCFFIAFIPIIFSALIGAHKSIISLSINGGESINVRGYWEHYNWTSYPLLLPLSLYLLRWMADKFFGLPTRYKPDYRVAFLLFFEDREANVRYKIQNELLKISLDKKNIFIVLIFAVIFHIADMWVPIEQYILYYQDSNYVPEIVSWANLFLLNNFLQGNLRHLSEAKIVNVTLNLLLIVFAYLNQFIIVLIGFTGITLVFRHNLFYLQRIYQRSRVQEDQIKSHIVLDFDDPDRRWGLTKLNFIFNIQVVLLVVAGLFLLFSRYANFLFYGSSEYFSLSSLIDLSSPSSAIKSLQEALENISLSKLFPDVGQVVIATAWMVAFIVVALPCFAKFLPFLSLGVLRQGLTITDYLREFIPPNLENTKYPLNTDDNVNAVAKKFARNSFWPAGDDIARFLFYFAFFIFFVLLVPLNLDVKEIGNLANIGLVFIMAIATTSGTLLLLRFVLSHVDSRLVDPGGK